MWRHSVKGRPLNYQKVLHQPFSPKRVASYRRPKRLLLRLIIFSSLFLFTNFIGFDSLSFTNRPLLLLHTNSLKPLTFPDTNNYNTNKTFQTRGSTVLVIFFGEVDKVVTPLLAYVVLASLSIQLLLPI